MPYGLCPWITPVAAPCRIGQTSITGFAPATTSAYATPRAVTAATAPTFRSRGRNSVAAATVTAMPASTPARSAQFRSTTFMYGGLITCPTTARASASRIAGRDGPRRAAPCQVAAASATTQAASRATPNVVYTACRLTDPAIRTAATSATSAGRTARRVSVSVMPPPGPAPAGSAAGSAGPRAR